MNAPSVKTEPAPPAAVYALPSFVPPWLGWLVATLCFFAAVFFAAKSFNVRGHLQSSLESERVARLEAGTLKNLLEAERILSRAQLNRLAQSGLDRLVILPLISPSDASVSFQGIIALNPSLREGIIIISNLPSSPAGKVYHVWATPETSDPLHLGNFPLAPESTDTRVTFTLPSDIRTFKITLDPESAPPSPESPTVLTTR